VVELEKRKPNLIGILPNHEGLVSLLLDKVTSYEVVGEKLVTLLPHEVPTINKNQHVL